MNKKNYILRLLTLAIYFLPFCFCYVSCDGYVSNKEDAMKLYNESYKNYKLERDKYIQDSILTQNHLSTYIYDTNPNFVGSMILTMYSTLGLFTSVLNHTSEPIIPQGSTLSAFGVIQTFVNKFGSICILISFLLSVLLLISERFFRNKNKLIIILFLLNILCVIAFIIDGLKYKMELKYGVLCLLLILNLQFFLEIKHSKKASLE